MYDQMRTISMYIFEQLGRPTCSKVHLLKFLNMNHHIRYSKPKKYVGLMYEIRDATSKMTSKQQELRRFQKHDYNLDRIYVMLK